MKFQDYYHTLGVARTATQDEIKRAYRKLAKEWHPDRHPPHRRKEAEERFKAIAEAHEVLSDQEKRKRYDQLGEHWRHGQDFQPPPGGGRTMSAEEFARMFGGDGSARGGFGGGFSDFFAQMFGDLFQGGARGGGKARGNDHARGGARAQRQSAPSRGEDVEADLELTVGEALRGGKRPFELQVAQPCPTCHGEGMVGFSTCPTCGGLGHSRTTRTVELSIPGDVRDGQVLRLRGLGEPGAGAPGDLLLAVHLVADDVHRLRGDDVEADLVIAPWEALDGTKVEVQVPAGTAAVKIPPGTRAGARLRLRGQGLTRADGERGDLLLVVRLGLPAELSEQQKAMLRELGRGAAPVAGGVRR
jgi:curved DNA-binding protein